MKRKVEIPLNILKDYLCADVHEGDENLSSTFLLIFNETKETRKPVKIYTFNALFAYASNTCNGQMLKIDTIKKETNTRFWLLVVEVLHPGNI